MEFLFAYPLFSALVIGIGLFFLGVFYAKGKVDKELVDDVIESTINYLIQENYVKIRKMNGEIELVKLDSDE